MKTITQEQLLMERIISLQTKQRSELQQLKIQFHNASQVLNPFSIIKTSLLEMDAVPNLKNMALNGLVNLTSHYLGKNSLLRIFQKPIYKILGPFVNELANKFSLK
jgi:hypothetical protein